MFKVNEKGNFRDRFVKNEALKMLIVGPIFSIIYLTLSYISMSKWVAFFYVVSPLLFIIIIFLFFVAPLKMLRRHNKTIKQIKFEDNYVIINVFSALWMKTKEFKLNRDILKVKVSKFPWYGKQIKEGITLREGNEYYLVFEYFNESEDIKRQLV